MDVYFNSVVDVTRANYEKKKDNDRKKTQQRYSDIKNTIEKIYNEITESGYKRIINDAANEGLTRAVIMTYETEPSEEFSLHFLWKGPVYNKFNTGVGLKYFQNINIIPLANLLQQHFSPFRINWFYNSKEEKHCFEVMW
jgi:virulence-associated protein VapD